MDKIEVEKIKCPICGEEKCYEDQHIDENEQFIIKEWLCYGCGYTSTSDYTISDAQNYEKYIPKSIASLRQIDVTRQLNWYPCVINTIKGYVFPELSADDWHWFSAPIVELDDTNLNKLPPESGAKIGDYVIALWLGEKYDKTEFEKACNNLGLMIERHKNVK